MNQMQSAPSTIPSAPRSDFAADQANQPMATPTSRPKSLPPTPMDSVQNPLPPLVPPPAHIELPPVPASPSPPQKTTANKPVPPLPNAPSGKATSPYSTVRYN